MVVADICVAYLIRIDEGHAPVKKFVETYTAHDPGVPHRLLVLRRGFRTEGQWIPFASELDHREVGYDVLDVDDHGYDLGAYHQALAASSDEYMCFMNTFSEVLSHGWLALLYRSACVPGVGLVGATASYESAYSAAVADYDLARTERRLPDSIRAWLRVKRLSSDFEPFPNPHIRTNGFIVKRSLALALRWGPFQRKVDALGGESGRIGLTRQADRLGLRNLVIGRDGLSYEHNEWAESGTFRCRDQSNLLLADNRTRQYDLASPPERERLGRLAWGPSYQAN